MSVHKIIKLEDWLSVPYCFHFLEKHDSDYLYICMLAEEEINKFVAWLGTFYLDYMLALKSDGLNN